MWDSQLWAVCNNRSGKAVIFCLILTLLCMYQFRKNEDGGELQFNSMNSNFRISKSPGERMGILSGVSKAIQAQIMELEAPRNCSKTIQCGSYASREP